MVSPRAIFPNSAGTWAHFSLHTGGCSKIRKYRQTPCLQAQVPVETDCFFRFLFMLYSQKKTEIFVRFFLTGLFIGAQF